MPTAIVTSDFRFTIPKEIREHLKIKPGQKLEVVCRGKVMSFYPVKPTEYQVEADVVKGDQTT